MKRDPKNPSQSSPEAPAPLEFDVLLTPAETARRYRMSKSLLDKMRCREGGPPFYAPTPRKIFYRPSEVDAWLAKRRYRSTRDYSNKEDE